MSMLRVADLFAGAGGCSTGLLEAATARGQRVDLVAVNHWPVSVETHTRNHPEARHFCASIETLDPRVAVARALCAAILDARRPAGAPVEAIA